MQSRLKAIKYFIFIFCFNLLGKIFATIPTKEEAIQKLMDYGIQQNIIEQFYDIKNESHGVQLWFSWYVCIPRFPIKDRTQKLEIYYYWLVAGLRQLDPLNQEDYAHIQGALKCVDKILKQSRNNTSKDLEARVAELKFVYLFEHEAYTEPFKSFAFHVLEGRSDIFPSVILNALLHLGENKNSALVFGKALSCIYNRCEDPDKEATELMFYLIGFSLYWVNAYTASLNKCINDALIELERTEDLLLDLTGCSFAKLMLMFNDAQQKEKIVNKNRKVQFGELPNRINSNTIVLPPILPGILKQKPESL